MNYALSLEYRDNANKLNRLRIHDEGTDTNKRKGKKRGDDEPFGDADAARTRDLASSLASQLGVVAQPGLGHVQQLEKVLAAAAPLADAIKRSKGQGGGALDLSALPLGFSTGDPLVDSAALVLRSLYIQDLRKLQSTIDETVVGVQEFTANPKTDAKLGKVGR